MDELITQMYVRIYHYFMTQIMLKGINIKFFGLLFLAYLAFPFFLGF